jgi:hypothetical protein
MDEAHNKLLERLRTYYGDDLACRTLLMDARHALEALAGEVETLRMKLAACGVGALSNTERTIKNNRIGPDSPYWSASLGDVYYIVDKEMKARTERDRLKAALAPFAAIKADDGDDFSAYDDQVVIRCEVTAGDLRKAHKALGDAS